MQTINSSHSPVVIIKLPTTTTTRTRTLCLNRLIHSHDDQQQQQRQLTFVDKRNGRAAAAGPRDAGPVWVDLIPASAFVFACCCRSPELRHKEKGEITIDCVCQSQTGEKDNSVARENTFPL
jgi:hypothetical protein